MHITGVPQLPHSSIHQGNSRCALLPSLQQRWIDITPGEVIKLGSKVLRIKLGKVKQDVVGKLPPSHFGEELGLVLLCLGGKRAIEFRPNLMGADFPKTEVGAEARCRDRARLIPSVIELQRVLDKILEPLVGSGFTGGPHVLETA